MQLDEETRKSNLWFGALWCRTRSKSVVVGFFRVRIKSLSKRGLPTWFRSQCNTSKKIYIFIGMHKKFLPQYST